MAPGKFAELKQGHAIIFASFLNHRVNPVRRGMRQSLVFGLEVNHLDD
jgi:predicted 2-oxoglutarate/Fe(II)-dependent dioxygenase YbiX